MLQRVKQVVAAVTAVINPADRQFVSKHLTLEEQTLFWRMNLPDQRHALNVAYTADKLSEHRSDVDRQLLRRCALLHDVGKVKGDVSTADKIITVAVHKITPKWARKWGRLGQGSRLRNLRHAFYIYFHHGTRGAGMLEELGLKKEAAIVAKHHEAPAADEPLELTILRKADDLN